MEWTQVLHSFHAIGLTAVTVSGRLVIEGPVSRLRPDVLAAIGEHRDTLVFILGGGHTWSPCSRCSQGLLLAVRTHKGKSRAAWPKCLLTPRCDEAGGVHRPRPEQVAALVAAGVPCPLPQAQLPSRSDRRRRGKPSSRFLGPFTGYPPIVGKRAA